MALADSAGLLFFNEPFSVVARLRFVKICFFGAMTMDIRKRLRNAPLSLMVGLVALGPSLAFAASDGQAGSFVMGDGDTSVSVSTSDALLAVPRPVKPLFEGPSLVTSGFSGTFFQTPAGASAPSLDDRHKFIDPNGFSASLVGIENIGFGFNGNEVKRLPYDRLLARDIGQVFGVAIDDAEKPNLYLTATSVFGLPIVGNDDDGDGVPDRLYTGRSDARFMEALFGQSVANGPGTVWKVDGETGQISQFASITLDGVENSGPGLGNIAFDPATKQLFVSDLDTGMVHRLDLEGNVLEAFDHGTTARSLAGRSEVPFDPANRLNITNPAFDVEDPDSWHYTAPERRVWGLAVHNGRLYYAVAEGPEVWSVGINGDNGAFLYDARWELSLPDDAPDFEISDITFAPDGSIVLAQRGDVVGSFDFTRLAKPRRARVMRFTLEKPDDPATQSRWMPKPREYAVGFDGQNDNGVGGLALGPGYKEDGRLDWKSCKGTLWTSGDGLRKHSELSDALAPGGELSVDGSQAQPLGLSKEHNAPPWMSYFLDYDGQYPTERRAGHVGDVEILGCHGKSESYDYGFYDYGYPGIPLDPGRDWWPCLINPELCEPPQRKQCLNTRTKLVCDKKTGFYRMQVIASDDLSHGFDSLSIEDPADIVSALPVERPFPTNANISLAPMVPGQFGQLELCAYNAAEKASGQPYDCCKASINYRLPPIKCGKGGLTLLKVGG